MTRRQARETMMQILYQLEADGEKTADRAEALCVQQISGIEKKRAVKILRATVEDLEEIDEMINRHSRSWKTSRMPRVDLAVLRLAVGESRYADDVSDAVVISEAINLAGKFSTENSPAFVHGLLGAIMQDAR